MVARVCAVLLVLTTSLAAADKTTEKMLQELQRDVADLVFSFKTFQKTVDTRFDTLGKQVESSLKAANDAQATATAVQKAVEKALSDQETKLLPPVAALGSRVDGVTTDFKSMKESVDSLVSVIAKIQTQLTDLNQAVRAAQTPVTPPAPVPPNTATNMLAAADGDRMAGKFDLALSEYQEFLKWYADDPQAYQAQYQIAQIRYSNDQFEAAITEYDTLMSKYPDNPRLPEALYYKGMSLRSLGRINQSADTFSELRKRFPNHQLAKQSLTPKKG